MSHTGTQNSLPCLVCVAFSQTFAKVMLFPHGYSFHLCCFENLVMKNFTIILHFHLQGLVVIFASLMSSCIRPIYLLCLNFFFLCISQGIGLRHGCLRMRMLSSRSHLIDTCIMFFKPSLLNSDFEQPVTG